MTFRKRLSGAPVGYAAWEAAGLRWLASTPSSGARVVDVRAVHAQALDLEPLNAVAPTLALAEDFGHRLAVTHDAGAAAFGCPPTSWTGDGWLGPADEPLPLPCRPTPTWGVFYAEQRIQHTLTLALARGHWRDPGERAAFERVADRLASGEFDDDDPPARLHGDLWSGNVLWTADGATLIDPAAHGGHRETDLAMLALFGAPHLSRILQAYGETHPLAEGWQRRVPLHQLHPVMLHAVLFGGGYAAQALAIARRYA